MELTHLRTEVTWEGDAGVDEAVHEVTRFWGDRPLSEEAQGALSVIVREMNECHGSDLSEEHKLVLDQYHEAFAAIPSVVDAAQNNDDFDAFKKVAFAPVFLDTVIKPDERQRGNLQVDPRRPRMREAFAEYLAKTVYDQARRDPS